LTAEAAAVVADLRTVKPKTLGLLQIYFLVVVEAIRPNRKDLQCSIIARGLVIERREIKKVD